jgi:hypothetical protein
MEIEWNWLNKVINTYTMKEGHNVRYSTGVILTYIFHGFSQSFQISRIYKITSFSYPSQLWYKSPSVLLDIVACIHIAK